MDPQDSDTTHLAPLIAKLRDRLEGRRAYLVTNRARSTISDWLHEKLGLVVELVDTKRQRRLESARDAILRGRRDLVLVVTAFVGHNVEHVLKPVCKRMDVPFVDIGRGRPLECLLELDRALFGTAADN